MYMKNYLRKEQKGITLVALVITVVVMLILAGVAIAAVVDGNGLFNRVRQATESYEEASNNESDQIKTLLNEIDNYLNDKPQIYTENKTYDGKTTGTYNNPIIPKGFGPINENGAIWGSADGYKKGLVIEDKIGNQFVWVPVDGEIVKFERQDWRNSDGKLLTYPENTTVGTDEDTQYTENIPTKITESVTINGGFYIARYEAGIATNMPQEELISDSSSTYGNGSYKPVSKQRAIVWNYIQWGEENNETTPGNGAVTVARSMYPKEDTNYGAISTLIYGTQWDTALRFIGSYNVGENGYDTYATNSTGMGNYSGTDGADDIASTSAPAECGARGGFSQKNIYDMAGNVYEWTMEKYSDNRTYRGGDYNCSSSQVSAAYCSYKDVQHNGAYRRFSCCTLYKAGMKF